MNQIEWAVSSERDQQKQIGSVGDLVSQADDATSPSQSVKLLSRPRKSACRSPFGP